MNLTLEIPSDSSLPKGMSLNLEQVIEFDVVVEGEPEFIIYQNQMVDIVESHLIFLSLVVYNTNETRHCFYYYDITNKVKDGIEITFGNVLIPPSLSDVKYRYLSSQTGRNYLLLVATIDNLLTLACSFGPNKIVQSITLNNSELRFQGTPKVIFINSQEFSTTMIVTNKIDAIFIFEVDISDLNNTVLKLTITKINQIAEFNPFNLKNHPTK